MKVFLSHPFYKHNKGDITVLRSILSLFRKIPAVKVNFQCIEPRPTIIGRFLENVDSLKLRFINSLEADVIILPTRDHLSLTYGLHTLLDTFCDIFLAVILRKTSMLFAAQVGPFGDGFKGKLASCLLGPLLNRIDLITVRDRISEKELIRLGITKPPIYVTADPGFLLEPVAPEKAEPLLSSRCISSKREKTIGINTSALAYRYAFPGVKSLDRKRIMYIDWMSRIIDWIVQETKAMVILVPHVFQLENDDRTIGREICEKVSCKDMVHLITEELEPEELKGIIGLFDMFIATRFHSLVHSTSMHVPTIAIDYTFKMKNLMAELDCSDWLCHIENVTFEELTSKIDRLWTIRKKIRENIGFRINDVKRRSELNIELVKGLILH